jgi:hypothetical protein
MFDFSKVIEGDVKVSFQNILDAMSKSNDGGQLATMISAAITAAKMMGAGTDDVKALGASIVMRLGVKGLGVPGEVVDMFLQLTPPVPVEQVPVVVASSKPAVSAKPCSEPAPARTIEKSFNTENAKRTWLGQLNGLIRGNNVSWNTVQGTAIRLFEAGVEFSETEWQTIFSAMKIADEKGGFIVGSNAIRMKAFYPPVELLRGFIFGQGGFLSCLSATITDSKGSLEPWMVAKSNVVIDLVDAMLDKEEMVQQEVSRIKVFEKLLIDHNAPNGLLSRFDDILAPEGDEGDESDIEDYRRRAEKEKPNFANHPRIVPEETSDSALVN